MFKRLERYEEAIKVLLESRQISIDKNDVVDGEDFELASCYVGIGDKENAQKYLDSARDSITERGLLNDYTKEKIEGNRKRNTFTRYTFQLSELLTTNTLRVLEPRVF